jgi:hypothetical protein
VFLLSGVLYCRHKISWYEKLPEVISIPKVFSGKIFVFCQLAQCRERYVGLIEIAAKKVMSYTDPTGYGKAFKVQDPYRGW